MRDVTPFRTDDAPPLTNHEERRLATYVIGRAWDDIWFCGYEKRKKALLWMDSSDFEFWCSLAGLNPDGVRRAVNKCDDPQRFSGPGPTGNPQEAKIEAYFVVCKFCLSSKLMPLERGPRRLYCSNECRRQQERERRRDKDRRYYRRKRENQQGQRQEV